MPATPILMPVSFSVGIRIDVRYDIPMSENRPDTGNYYPWMQKGADNQPDVDVISVAAVAGCGQRRTEARGKMQELLCYDPESVELAPRILQSCECDGFTRHVVLCPNAFYFGSQRLPTA
jgi:hypothetical protein